MAQRIKALQVFTSSAGACDVGDVITVDDATAAFFITAGFAEEVGDEVRTADETPVKKKAVKWESDQV
jgi:hypothetical protein